MKDDSIKLADGKADVTVSAPELIGQGFMTYERYEVSLRRDGEPPLLQRRDVLRASRVAAVLAIDLGRDQLVLIRQFRLPAHLATGRGDMVEIVAGRVEPGESPDAAARRECLEEIGVAPQLVVELFSVLATPGFTDEYVTFFAGFLDSAEILTRGGVADEDEDTHPFVVSIDQALAALERGEVLNALLVSALQWLALHRGRLRDYLSRAA
ncbi:MULTISPECIES: NUDIX domain-containing protein [Rhodopseudomonas]|uniref:ADP-ribose pyrophosphatase n=1 Tax=Rhodopseudomonas palustris TaxID=1076 RepID=A0A0D7EK54_RHOPL|nr:MULTISPECIES: NUDIX domain-containing protein [Rhodopseudomonas]KIZ40915.1 nucleoside diphosphate pyrophosphatase [Rhodopseudomonas palustris]MDF3812326.1 NUDIX domain-containing protein [Rhodopseudomonas sp. BAL398]WOK18168.1 NUDIX domain-containing protein [Rhodopseudomonas sp. BAL398]